MTGAIQSAEAPPTPTPLGPTPVIISNTGLPQPDEIASHGPVATNLQTEPVAEPQGPSLAALPSELEIGTDSSDVSFSFNINGNQISRPEAK